MTDVLATNYRPRRAKHPAVEVPAWFLAVLVLLALAPTLLVVVYAIMNG